jgi:hypothetical protein
MALQVLMLAVASILFSPTVPSVAAERVALRSKGRIPDDFSVPQAMKSLYDNFDASTQTSVSSVPIGSARSSFLDRADKIEVHPFLIISARESNKRKVFLLTYAVPDSESFECHLCAPLIGMAVFGRTNEGWSIESSNNGMVVFGQWGNPPDARLLRIGQGHVGIELRITTQGQGETTTVISFLVPWKGEITEALRTEVADDDGGICGDGGMLPCYKNRRKITFVKGAEAGYDDLVLTLSGTVLTKEPPFKTVMLNQVERRKFSEGKYVIAPH